MRPFIVKPARHGHGLFAARSIVPGEVILRVNGPVISYKQVLRMKKPDNAFQLSRNRYVNFRKPGVLANHSCAPNAGVTPERTLIAIRPIKRGEEITYDYSACMDKDTVCDFICGCKAKSCRKTIKGFKTVPKQKQEFYRRLGVVQEFLLKER